MAPGVHGSLQIVLWHEFEDVLEATTMVRGSPFDAFRQRSIAGQTPCKTDRNLVFESSSIQITTSPLSIFPSHPGLAACRHSGEEKRLCQLFGFKHVGKKFR